MKLQARAEPSAPVGWPFKLRAGLNRPAGEKYLAEGAALVESAGPWGGISDDQPRYPLGADRRLLGQAAQAIIDQLPAGVLIVDGGHSGPGPLRPLLEALVQRDGRADLVCVDAADRMAWRAAAQRMHGVEMTTMPLPLAEVCVHISKRMPERPVAVVMLGNTLGCHPLEDARLWLANLVELLAPAVQGRALRFVIGLELVDADARLQGSCADPAVEQVVVDRLCQALSSVNGHGPLDPADWSYVCTSDRGDVRLLAEALRPIELDGLHIAGGEQVLVEQIHVFDEADRRFVFEGFDVRVAVAEQSRELYVLAPAPREGASVPWMQYGDRDIEIIDGVAALDYAAFARTYDWDRLAGERLAVLDVGCGSGALAGLLPETNPASAAFVGRVDRYDLLDLSANSLRIAGEWVPFHVAARFHSTIQDFARSRSFARARAAYDLVWSIHGITAVRPSDMWASLDVMLACLRDGGQLVIVMSDHDSHYATLDRVWLDDQRTADGAEPRARFLESEDIARALTRAGVAHDVLDIATEHVFPAEERETWGRFAAWCVYGTPDAVHAPGPTTARYLDSIHSSAPAGHRLRLSSQAITVRLDWLTLLRWRVRRPGVELRALEGQTYATCCDAFEHRSSQRREMVRDFAEAAGAVDGDGPKSLRVMSLGCGDGTLDRALLETMAAPGRSIHYRGVDNNPEQRRRCHQTMADTPPWLHTALQSPEQFADDPDGHDFDCIFIAHALYYFDDPGAAIADCLARLRPGGRLFVWMAPFEQMNRLSSVFWQPTSPQTIPFAEDLEQLFTAQGHTCARQRIDGHLDLGERGPGYTDALSFLVQVEVDRLPDDVVEALEAAVEHMSEPDGRLPHPVYRYTLTRA